MEENVAKFSEKLKELLAMAKKKKNVLEYQEISDFFSGYGTGCGANSIRSLTILEQNNIDVLRITDDDDDGRVRILFSVTRMMWMWSRSTLSVPDGVSIEDPVRMYSERDR